MNKLRYTTFQNKPTKTTEIENIIKTHKPKNSCEYDEISTKLLPLIIYVFKVITEGIFPDRLKYSIIQPLHKKGNKKMLAVVQCYCVCLVSAECP
jgi:hypothetical protein